MGVQELLGPTPSTSHLTEEMPRVPTSVASWRPSPELGRARWRKPHPGARVTSQFPLSRPGVFPVGRGFGQSLPGAPAPFLPLPIRVEPISHAVWFHGYETHGVRIMRLAEGDTVASIGIVLPEETEEEAEKPAGEPLREPHPHFN